MSEALVPALSAGRVEVERPGAAGVALPTVIVDAGPAAVERFLEYFAAAIANARTRAAYGRAVGRFLPDVAGDRAAPRRRLHPDAPGVGADRQAAPGGQFGRSATGWSSARCCP